MKKYFEKLKLDQLLYIFLCGINLVSLIPIIMISKYNIPLYDDLSISLLTNQAVRQGGNFLTILKVAIDNTIHIYDSWQGTYMASFLISLQPGIFGHQYYGFGSLFLFFCFFVAITFLCFVIFRKVFDCGLYFWKILSLMLFFVQTQCLPSVQEGFFWWSGGIAHTFFYSMFLILIGIILLQIKNNKIKIHYIVLTVLLIFIVAGAALEIAFLLLTAMCTIVFIVYVLFPKMNVIKRASKYLMVFYLCVVLVFVGINIVAPGNFSRLESSTSNPSIISSIVQSFIYSIVHVFEYTSISTLLVACGVFVVTYIYFAKHKMKIIHPRVTFIISWCLYSTIFTPAIYAENYVASLRYLNILYFSFFWFLIVNTMSLSCYFASKTKLNFVDELLAVAYIKPWLTTIISIFLLISSVFQFSYTDATSASIVVDMINKKHLSYKLINDERFALLEESSSEEVILPRFEENIKVFYNFDISEDSTNPSNITFAKYYNQSSVKVDVK